MIVVGKNAAKLKCDYWLKSLHGGRLWMDGAVKPDLRKGGDLARHVPQGLNSGGV